MVVSVVMMFVIGTFKEKHLDCNHCAGTAMPLRGFSTPARDSTVTGILYKVGLAHIQLSGFSPVRVFSKMF